MTELEERILRLIPVGADEPRAGRDIANVLGLEMRALRDHILRLIVRYGIPIVAERGAKTLKTVEKETEKGAIVWPSMKAEGLDH